MRPGGRPDTATGSKFGLDGATVPAVCRDSRGRPEEDRGLGALPEAAEAAVPGLEFVDGGREFRLVEVRP